MEACGRISVQVHRDMSPTSIVYVIEYQSRDWHSNPIPFGGSPLHAIHHVTDDIMRSAMRSVEMVIVHPAVYDELLRAVSQNSRVYPDFDRFLSPDGKPLGKIENIEPEETPFMTELLKIE